jgi:imidazolonepropionase-like amidohydrolase
VQALHHAGVRILAGTDTPMPLVYPGFSLHDELQLLVASGLTPAEALRAATQAPAEFLGIDADAGSIAAGKRADLVLLNANPLDDIKNTRTIRAVVLNGRLFDRAALDELLRKAADAAATPSSNHNQ